MAAVLKRLTVQLEYFDGLVVLTHLIKPGHIRVTSGSNLHYYPGQWVIQVSDGDPVATLATTIRQVSHCYIPAPNGHTCASICHIKVENFESVNEYTDSLMYTSMTTYQISFHSMFWCTAD